MIGEPCNHLLTVLIGDDTMILDIWVDILQAPSSLITVSVRQSITQYTGTIDSIHDVMACIMRNTWKHYLLYQLYIEHQTKVWKPFTSYVSLSLWHGTFARCRTWKIKLTCRMMTAFCQKTLVHLCTAVEARCSMDDKGTMLWDAPPSSSHLTWILAWMLSEGNVLLSMVVASIQVLGRSQALKSFKISLKKLISFTYKKSRISFTINYIHGTAHAARFQTNAQTITRSMAVISLE